MMEGEKQFIAAKEVASPISPDTESRQERKERSPKILKQPWFQLVVQARNEFSGPVSRTIDIMVAGGRISDKEYGALYREITYWWKERFGSSFVNKKKRDLLLQHGLPVLDPLPRVKEFSPQEVKNLPHPEAIYAREKERRMSRLRVALRQLDRGEPVQEFEYATRKRVYYDAARGTYYVPGEEAYPLTFGDILSDYAWEIKYAPETSAFADKVLFRKFAKNILVNEARRDIESIYNQELAVRNPGIGGLQNVAHFLETKELPRGGGQSGVVAEIMARETLARIASSRDFGFAVFRANILEDGLYKYDFKLRARERRRGVAVEDEPDFAKRVRKVGVQFSIGAQHSNSQLLKVKEQYRNELPVDDIVLLKIRSGEFESVFNEWLRRGKPPGGPERFLPHAIKADILKRASEGLVRLSDEEITKAVS